MAHEGEENHLTPMGLIAAGIFWLSVVVFFIGWITVILWILRLIQFLPVRDWLSFWFTL